MTDQHVDRPPAPARAPSSPSRSVGRPRRLSLSQVLDAAIEIGLDGLTMAALAKHLNVSAAVLYTYVSGRTELVRLAAQRASGVAAFPEDTGQSWREYATQYAEAHFKLVEEGQLVSTLFKGELSPSSKLDSAEQWVQFMQRHGFTVRAALDLLRAIDVIVLGGALLAAYAKAVAGDAAHYPDLLRETLAHRRPDDLPILSHHAEEFAASAAPAWRNALTLFLNGVVAGTEPRAE